MKKFTFTLMLMLFSTIFAVTYAGDTFIAGFEDGEAGYVINNSNRWYNSYDWVVTSNTESSGINNSDKCFMATTNVTTPPDRWGYWMWIDLDQPITITESTRYLKIMGKRSPNTTTMSVGIANDGYKESTYFGQQKPSKTGVWGDMVFDLFNGKNADGIETTCQNLEVKTFIIFLGTWEGVEVGTCMLDNIVLSDSDKPRGAKEMKPGLLVNFEDANLTANNWSNFGVQSPEASYTIDVNPVKTEPNPTDMALKYNKPANTTWWHSLMCYPNDIIPVQYPNIYFHVMMYIPDATSTTLNISATSGITVTDKKYPEDGENWFDYVVDVSELNYINQVAFRFNQDTEDNWNNPAGVYYVDDFVLNDDPNPRTSTTPMGVKKLTFDNVKVYTEDGYACIASPELKSATVYSVCGQMPVKQTTSNSIIKFNLPKGTYIIKVESQTGTVSTHKLIVF